MASGCSLGCVSSLDYSFCVLRLTYLGKHQYYSLYGSLLQLQYRTPQKAILMIKPPRLDPEFYGFLVWGLHLGLVWCFLNPWALP